MVKLYGKNIGEEQVLLSIYTSIDEAKRHIREWATWYTKVDVVTTEEPKL